MYVHVYKKLKINNKKTLHIVITNNYLHECVQVRYEECMYLKLHVPGTVKRTSVCERNLMSYRYSTYILVSQDIKLRSPLTDM